MTQAPTLSEVLESFPDGWHEALQQTGQRISREFYRMVDPDDLVSEFVVWLGGHTTRAKHWWFTDDEDRRQFSWRNYRRDAAAVMAGVARGEKARAIGYDEDDEQFYAVLQIKDLLQYVWHESTFIAEGGPEVRTSTPNDPSKGGSKATSIADVRVAYRKVVRSGSKWDQVLALSFRDGLTQGEVAQALGLHQSTVSRTLNRALGALAREMNGTEPWRDGPGTRRVLSNTAAVAATRTTETG